MSRTDHPRLPGTHRAWTRNDRYDPEHEYDLMPQKRIRLCVVPDQVAIAEALAEMAEGQPLPWWGLTPERKVESRVIDRNFDNAWLMDDLADMAPAERALLERDGHSNLIPFQPRLGWNDPLEPDYWDDEDDEDEDLDEPAMTAGRPEDPYYTNAWLREEPLAPWERELLGMSA